MSEALRIGVRVLFAYAILHQLIRHAGHRVVATGAGGTSEGSGIDLLLTLIMGDLIDDLLWAETSAVQFVVAAGTLAVVHVLAKAVSRNNHGWWKAINGVPVGLVIDGTPQRRAMRASRIGGSELAALLRREGIARNRWSEIRATYLENSGTLSVLLRPSAKPATRKDRGSVRKAVS